MFREVQRFRQSWIWALLGGVALLMLALGPVTWGGLLIVGAVAAFVYSLRLLTEVRADGIYLKMWPLHRSFRRISWSEVERYEPKRYGPLGEFGGWGIQMSAGLPVRFADVDVETPGTVVTEPTAWSGPGHAATGRYVHVGQRVTHIPDADCRRPAARR
jgi:hypothetical protein